MDHHHSSDNQRTATKVRFTEPSDLPKADGIFNTEEDSSLVTVNLYLNYT